MKDNLKISAVILAAGSSVRFGEGDKLEAKICGKPVLSYAVEAFMLTDEVDEIIVVTRKDRIDGIKNRFPQKNIKVIEGGETRNASSLAGTKAAAGDIVLIHDGARPFIDRSVIKRCIDGALKKGAVAAAVKAVDTIKICDADGAVSETTRRSNTYRTQSPQAFNRNLLLCAYENIDVTDISLTDDCMVMEKAGRRVYLVEGSEHNIKITTRFDIAVAESIAKELGIVKTPRICSAIGQDSHRTAAVPGKERLILGGVKFEDYPALEANSDGDVVLHALTNAISGITSENILGARADKICFGGNRDSRAYLAEALKFLNGKITHVSFTIECKAPHLSAKIPQMRESIGKLIELPPERVGITATSGEGLTDFGRGLGISVFCIVTAEVY